MKECKIDGCGRPHRSRGWCNTHYMRWYMHGDAENPGSYSVYKTAEESFAARTNLDGECLVWTGGKKSDGYGQITVDGKQIPVHRYAWEVANGPIPDGAYIDHRCHNRACVNLIRLRLASPAQNTRNREGAMPRSTTGYRNVYPKPSGRYQVIVGGRYFGTHSEIGDAIRVAEEARAHMFGEFAGKG